MVENQTILPKPLAGTIDSLIGQLAAGPKKRNARLTECWPKIVGKVNAEKTTPRFRESTVTVWAENSTLAFEMSRHYGEVILKRLKNEFGEDEVKKIWFCVGNPQ